MRGDRFWKIIVTLCLTFWLGTFIADLFVSDKKPSKEAVVAEKRNCEPVDKTLKYQLLGDEKQKKVDKKDETLYRTGKDGFEYETLLHKEYCYESKK